MRIESDSGSSPDRPLPVVVNAQADERPTRFITRMTGVIVKRAKSEISTDHHNINTGLKLKWYKRPAHNWKIVGFKSHKTHHNNKCSYDPHIV